MSSDEYNEVALDLALNNLDKIIEIVDNWYRERKMTDEAYDQIARELGIAWGLVYYVKDNQKKEPTDILKGEIINEKKSRKERTSPHGKKEQIVYTSESDGRKGPDEA